MKLRKRLARFCAKYSCAKWDPYQPYRVILRHIFWWLANKDVKNLAKMAKCKNYENSIALRDAFFLRNWVLSPTFDLYGATLYGESSIFGLVVDDNSRISDPSRMVIGYATSNCALRIRVATGKWPSGQPCDSKDWVDYLMRNGFTEVSEQTPTLMDEDERHSKQITPYYIGVLPEVGEHGLVVWTNAYSAEMAKVNCYNELELEKTKGTIVCSTYWEGEFKCLLLPDPRYGKVTWVKIA